jgi:hypothetical protein
MFNEITHQYSEHKNKELPWLVADDGNTYFKNLKINKDKLTEYNWVDRHFTYRFNSHGFRSDEFSNDDSVMFLGCSMTVGIGLPLEDTWAYQVAKTLNLKCFNLSIGGSGPDTAFRLANHYIPQIKPKLVVYLEPPPGRFSLLSANGEFYQFITGNLNFIDPMFRKYYEHWISLEENLTLNSLKHKLAIQAICQEHNIKFVFGNSYTDMPFVDYARDLIHAGVKSNKMLAELILDRINQNN